MLRIPIIVDERYDKLCLKTIGNLFISGFYWKPFIAAVDSPIGLNKSVGGIRMRIQIVYYAWLKEKFGEKETLESEEELTVGKVVESLMEKHPDLRGEEFLIAVNGKIAGLNVWVKEGDILAVLPPAGGG